MRISFNERCRNIRLRRDETNPDRLKNKNNGNEVRERTAYRGE
jgi:hypothetical protein